MEILKILEESGKDLYLEDLDFFETELATGDHYDAAYQAQCRSMIKKLRTWLSGEATGKVKIEKEKENGKVPTAMVVELEELAPKEPGSVVAAVTAEQQIFRDIAIIRERSTYKTSFKKYIAKMVEVDATFVDAHYSFFQPWELGAILSVKQMGEAFLEKYFTVLDHQKIARYQLFSEKFFIRHFAQLDAEIVLTKGKNDWRKKEKRSAQLDVFLRLKGIQK